MIPTLREYMVQKPQLTSQKKLDSDDDDDEGSGDDSIEVVSEIAATPKRSSVKLASIFYARKSKPPEVHEDPAAVAARKAFLSSSAPESLRTQVKEADELVAAYNSRLTFPKVSHVRQRDDSAIWSLDVTFKLKSLVPEVVCDVEAVRWPGWKKFFNVSPSIADMNSTSKLTLRRMNIKQICGVLQVWPLTQFFLFPFCKKIIDEPGEQINDP